MDYGDVPGLTGQLVEMVMYLMIDRLAKPNVRQKMGAPPFAS